MSSIVRICSGEFKRCGAPAERSQASPFPGELATATILSGPRCGHSRKSAQLQNIRCIAWS